METPTPTGPPSNSETPAAARPRTVVVTGATGFLGGYTARTLAQAGHTVIALGRNAAKGRALEADGVRFVAANLTDRDAMHAAIEGADVVVHSGALSSAWGTRKAFYAANVDGTENVIEACLAHGIERLIYISSPSVLSQHMEQLDLDRDAPFPQTYVSVYSESKAEAERRVIAAGSRGLPFVILRPKAIYGPGDTALFPRIMQALGSKRLPVFGDGYTLTQITHVEDVVQSIVCALDAEAALGKTYLVTGDEQVNLWDLIHLVADEMGFPRPHKRLSVRKAMVVARIMEWAWRWLPLPGEPLLTRYKVSIFSYSQTYDIAATRDELGYAPRRSWQEGVRAFIAHIKANAGTP